MKALLKSLFAPKTKTRPAAPARFQPNLEALEQRALMAAGLSYNGMLSISGGWGNDVASVSTSGGNVIVNLNEGYGNRTYVFNGARVKDIVFSGNDGNDIFVNNTAFISRVYGGNGNDWLQGGFGSDIIYGENGNDTIIGGFGNDFLYGQNGADNMDGGAGNDVLYGGFGADTMQGAAGDDFLNGEQDNDWMSGGDGNDTLSGSLGNDTLLGWTGRDMLYGNEGDDYLNGGQDGVFDGTYGGTGYDTFVTEWYWNGYSWKNRDEIQDWCYLGMQDRWINP